jgi:hypothetical protein
VGRLLTGGSATSWLGSDVTVATAKTKNIIMPSLALAVNRICTARKGDMRSPWIYINSLITMHYSSWRRETALGLVSDVASLRRSSLVSRSAKLVRPHVRGQSKGANPEGRASHDPSQRRNLGSSNWNLVSPPCLIRRSRLRPAFDGCSFLSRGWSRLQHHNFIRDGIFFTL